MRFSGKTVATAAAAAANTTANTTTTSCTGALRGKKKKEEEEKEERKKGINKYEWPLAGQQRNRKRKSPSPGHCTGTHFLLPVRLTALLKIEDRAKFLGFVL